MSIAGCWRPAVCAFFALLLALLPGCGEHSSRDTLSGGTMGTTWSVVYETRDGVSRETLLQLIEAELVAINDALSTYIPDSEISRLNARSAASRSDEVILSERFAAVLDAALDVGAATGGAYDVTVGPLVELWGFGARAFTGTVPQVSDIDEARAAVGAERLHWNADTRRLSLPVGYRIDLSSLAKGYAVDRLASLLAERGIENSLVEIGGELLARGSRPEGGPWRVAIESPDPALAGVMQALELRDVAVATSGDYRNYFEVDGRKYSHLVDPRSGYPVDHDLVSVTVVHENCMLADAWATALIVLGRERALELAQSQSLAAHLVSRNGDALEVHYTPAFGRYLRTESAERTDG